MPAEPRRSRPRAEPPPPALRGAWAEIDLDAIRDNVGALLRILTGSARLMAVVKANAYGHGAVQVAHAAAAAGAWGFGVATVDEAEELRRGGIGGPVVVLGMTTPEEAGRIARLDAAAAVSDLEAARVLSAAAPRGRPARVHLKVDTGMGRAGCAPADALPLAKAIAALPGAALEGCYTHFPAAGEVDLGPTRDQMGVFSDVLRALGTAGITVPLRHAAASAATLALPEAHLDAVRCGIAVYGIPPAPHLCGRIPLRPAMRLCGRIARVTRVPAGTAVGYGRQYRAPRETTIATIPLGYADGYPWAAWRSAAVALGGRRLPIAGRVSMDQLTVDAGDLRVRHGDEAELWGTAIPVEEIAAAGDTIPWELLARVSARVPRVFTSGGVVQAVRTLVWAWDRPPAEAYAVKEGGTRRARRVSG